MKEHFKNLTKAEVELLLKAPALVSVYAVNGNKEISNFETADAIKLSHLKTFTAIPSLLPYYRDVEKNFKNNFETIVKKYSPFDDDKRGKLKKEIDNVNTIIGKLNPDFAKTIHTSLSNYAEHMRKADRSVVEDFILPFLIKGLTY